VSTRGPPVIDVTAAATHAAPGGRPSADLRIHVPGIGSFAMAPAEKDEPTDIRGCGAKIPSASCSAARSRSNGPAAAGLPVGTSMRAERAHVPHERFLPRRRQVRGSAGVSMRPYRPEQIRQATESPPAIRGCTGAPLYSATGRYRHSPPRSADFGDAVTIPAGEVPVFWARRHATARLRKRPLRAAITHSPPYVCERSARCRVL